jgi:hypothetical protein
MADNAININIGPRLSIAWWASDVLYFGNIRTHAQADEELAKDLE